MTILVSEGMGCGKTLVVLNDLLRSMADCMFAKVYCGLHIGSDAGGSITSLGLREAQFWLGRRHKCGWIFAYKGGVRYCYFLIYQICSFEYYVHATYAK